MCIIIMCNIELINKICLYFCRTDFFFKIMNKQEYNELNLIISYVALLVSNGD